MDYGRSFGIILPFLLGTLLFSFLQLIAQSEAGPFDWNSYASRQSLVRSLC